MYRHRLTDYLPDLMKALQAQLESDQERWGDTWKNRPVLGQEKRAYQRFNAYWQNYEELGTPIPWLKIIGEALICWVRERT